MIIKFFPFIQTMIEQSEVVEIINNKLIFTRIYGADKVSQTFDLSQDLLDIFNKLIIEDTELTNGDVVIVDDLYKFNLDNASLSYKTFCKLLTKELAFKYNPRALNHENVLFYLGDFNKMYEFHYYQEALDLINKNNLILQENKVVINKEEITITLDKYKVVEFNTDNKLYQVVISTLKYNEMM